MMDRNPPARWCPPTNRVREMHRGANGPAPLRPPAVDRLIPAERPDSPTAALALASAPGPRSREPCLAALSARHSFRAPVPRQEASMAPRLAPASDDAAEQARHAPHVE